MKPFLQQIGIYVAVIALAALTRVAWSAEPTGEGVAYTDEQLQQALDVAEGQGRLQPGGQPTTGSEVFHSQLQRANGEADAQLSPAELQELMQIRQSLRGDAPAFEPGSPDPSTSATPQPTISPPTAAWPQVPNHTAGPQPEPALRPLVGRPGPMLSPMARRGQQRSVDVLRNSARQFDQLANELESCELYDQADAARRLAQRLRVDARKLSARPHQPGVGHPQPYGFTEPPAPHFDHPWSQRPGPLGLLDPAPRPGPAEIRQDAPRDAPSTDPAAELR